MNPHDTLSCPMCGKPLRLVEGLYECEHCKHAIEVYGKDNEVWTMIRAPIKNVRINWFV